MGKAKTTIKRTYVSKKTGEVITKIYTYDKEKYKYRVDKLTTKSGKKSKRYDALLNKEFSLENQNIKTYISNTIAKYVATKKVITLGQLKAMVGHNRLAIFLANFQLSLEDIHTDLQLQGVDVSKAWLKNDNHWTFHSGSEDADITLPDGKTAYFVFNYYEHTYDIEVK